MILQDAIPYDVFAQRPLPGIAPATMADWLHVDEAYGAQMAERRRLILEERDKVHACLKTGEAPARELLGMILAMLADDPRFDVTESAVTGPDGVTTTIEHDAPLLTLGRILQEDFCIMTRAGEAHELSAAILCFPASWRLAEKIGRPLLGIHTPVPEYPDIAARVQRLFDGVQVDRPLWRFNVLNYDDPTLFQPRSEHMPRPLESAEAAPFLRSERQVLVRLPETRAVVFSIHTYLVRRSGAYGPKTDARD